LYPDQAVILRGDQAADYRHIVAVLDICRAANIWNVAFATGRPES
jgi:biopolymer transport protein ExbD